MASGQVLVSAIGGRLLRIRSLTSSSTAIMSQALRVGISPSIPIRVRLLEVRDRPRVEV
jgi:hypothetical protein